MDETTAKRVQRAIEALGQLPVLDHTVRKVCELADLDTGDAELLATIERDETFAVNLLRYANSAAYARRFRPGSVSEAVTTIGRRELRRIAIEAVTYRYLERVPGNGGASRGLLHLHAVAVATCAVETAERVGADPDVAHLAGLLHDIGKLVLPLVFGEVELDRIALAVRSGPARVEAERAALGIDHAEVGALVARAADLPAAVVEAVALHHGAGPGARGGGYTLSREAACVQVANAAVALLDGAAAEAGCCAAALTLLGLDESILEELAESVVPKPAQATAPLIRRVAELERAASTDSLTGVANRGHWFTFVGERLADGRDGAVFLCDIDFLKRVNDTYGHAAGDEVIQQTARVLDGYGFVGRLGGDEFTVWIEGDSRRAGARSNDLVEELAARLAVLPKAGSATASIGVAMTDSHGHVLDALVEAADRALYQAKALGRRRACAA